MEEKIKIAVLCLDVLDVENINVNLDMTEESFG